MTREEAIQYLEGMRIDRFKGYDSFGEFIKERNEAIDMAILALSEKQVTSKLKKPCDSLLTEDSEDSKEQKSKLDHDREWIIGCIKHDGFIKTDRFDKANQIILEALEQTEPKDRLIKFFADNLTEEEIAKGEEYAKGYADGLKVKEHIQPLRQTEECAIELLQMTGRLQEHDKELSAERVGEWVPLIHETDMTTNFPWERDGQWVIVTDGKTISVERIKKDAYDHFFPNGRWFELEHTTAWMPLPQPYGAKMKGGTE